jgi:hypothetical protein
VKGEKKMKEHRVRLARPTDGKPESHVFVEMSPDTWLEVSEVPSHCEIHAELSRWTENSGPITYADRAFNIGIVREWREGEAVLE